MQVEQPLITFSMFEKNTLHVVIETKNLHIRSTISEDLPSYISLFSDLEVMKTVNSGIVLTQENIKNRINEIWVRRWKQNDPYSGFTILQKNTKEFLGHITLGHTGSPGIAAIKLLFMKTHWNKGYGTEAAQAIVQAYAPEIHKKGYMLDGEQLQQITATTQIDTCEFIEKILQKIGMSKHTPPEQLGNFRNCYAISMSQLLQKHN